MTNHEEKLIFPHHGSLNFPEFVACFLNSMIGTGVLRLGSAFNSGIIFTHILNIFIAVISFYSLKLFVLAASCYHESTFEEVWSVAFTRKLMFIPAICSILSSFSNIMSYLGYLQSSLVQIISYIILLVNKDGQDIIRSMEQYSILFGLVIFIVLCVPASISTDLKFVVITSFISLAFFFCLLIYVIVRFCVMVSRDGFDPNHRFKLFDVKDNISSGISSLTYAYLFYPFAWPGLRHARNSTVKGLTNMFAATIIIAFILYSIMGTFSYLSFFNENTGGIILDYYPSDTTTNEILLIIGHIFTFVYILLTVPVVLNPARYILLNCINKRDSFPTEIWALIGITLSLISLFLANTPDRISDIIFIITDLLTLILLFIFPPIFYLRGFGTKNKLHFVGAIFEILIGLALISFMIYLDCTS
ncbi:hypothetical protein M9Y10_000237 [Tritrichomonas musculus]|uniref:Amino acid transporter transmembrane domain-containing protein n=1 Tax=Tritrichomonas musculus TaxID=1915356 RepID=A0ABR2L5F8_9EUKA